MTVTVEVRPAVLADADGISRTILRALRQTNARDYPPHVIAPVAENFSPARVVALLAARQAYVALVDGVVIGTAVYTDESFAAFTSTLTIKAGASARG